MTRYTDYNRDKAKEAMDRANNTNRAAMYAICALGLLFLMWYGGEDLMVFGSETVIPWIMGYGY